MNNNTLLKTGSLDNAIREFSLASQHGIGTMASVCVIFLGFCFYCSLVFYIFGAFLIKQLFHSRLLDMI